MDRVALLQQQLGQKCAVLTGYAGDQRDLGTTVHSVAFRHIRGFLVRRSAAAPSLPSPASGGGYREGPGCRLRHVSHQTAARQGGAWDPARSVIAVPWTAIGATLRPPPFAGSVPKDLGVAGSSAATTPLL